jgi:hypothetical protein
MIIEFTDQEGYAVAACLLHTACAKTTTSHMTNMEKQSLLDINHVAVRLLEYSKLQPHHIKDLGTRVLSAVLTAEINRLEGKSDV